MRCVAPGSPEGICVWASAAVRAVLVLREPTIPERWERPVKSMRDWQVGRGPHHAQLASRCRGRDLAAMSWPGRRGLGATEQSTGPSYTAAGSPAPFAWGPAVQTATRPVPHDLDLEGGFMPLGMTRPAGPVPSDPGVQSRSLPDKDGSRTAASFQTGPPGRSESISQQSQHSTGKADMIHAGVLSCNEQAQRDVGAVAQQLSVPPPRTLAPGGSERDVSAPPAELQRGGLGLNSDPGRSGGGDVPRQGAPGLTGERSGSFDDGDACSPEVLGRQVNGGHAKAAREGVVEQPWDADGLDEVTRADLLSGAWKSEPLAAQPSGRTEATLAVEFLEGQVSFH